MIHTLINYLTTLPVSDYQHLGEFLVTIVGTPLFVQILKHFKNWHGEKTLIKFLTPITAAFTGLIYLHTTGLVDTVSTGNKATLVGAITWLSTIVYDIAVSPLYKRFIVNWTSSMAEASAYLNEVKANPVPETQPVAEANFNV